jgi:hypothetical protein
LSLLHSLPSRAKRSGSVAAIIVIVDRRRPTKRLTADRTSAIVGDSTAISFFSDRDADVAFWKISTKELYRSPRLSHGHLDRQTTTDARRDAATQKRQASNQQPATSNNSSSKPQATSSSQHKK